MPRKSQLSGLPNAIREELLTRILERGHTFEEIAEWLAQKQSEKISKSTLGRIGKATRDKYGVLVVLGMPIKEIIKTGH